MKRATKKVVKQLISDYAKVQDGAVAALSTWVVLPADFAGTKDSPTINFRLYDEVKDNLIKEFPILEDGRYRSLINRTINNCGLRAKAPRKNAGGGNKGGGNKGGGNKEASSLVELLNEIVTGSRKATKNEKAAIMAAAGFLSIS